MVATKTAGADNIGSRLYVGFSDFFSGVFSSGFENMPLPPPPPPAPASARTERNDALYNDDSSVPSHGQGIFPPARRGASEDAPKRMPSQDGHMDWAVNRAKSLDTPLHMNGLGGQRRKQEEEDLLDQHVQYYLRKHPKVCNRHVLVRLREGVYELDGREVTIEWQYASEPGMQGHLVVVDGPLRQPLADYMQETDINAEYEVYDITPCKLHMIPKEKRVSFNDQGKEYSRLEAMKVAKEQALVREKAAGYVQQGREVPGDLMAKYNKAIQVKLGLPRKSQAKPQQQEQQQQQTAHPQHPQPPPQQLQQQQQQQVQVEQAVPQTPQTSRSRRDLDIAVPPASPEARKAPQTPTQTPRSIPVSPFPQWGGFSAPGTIANIPVIGLASPQNAGILASPNTSRPQYIPVAGAEFPSTGALPSMRSITPMKGRPAAGLTPPDLFSAVASKQPQQQQPWLPIATPWLQTTSL